MPFSCAAPAPGRPPDPRTLRDRVRTTGSFAEPIAPLEPGDTVTIETAADFARPCRALAAVVRVAGPHIVVTRKSRSG